VGAVLTSEQATNGSEPYGFNYAYDLAAEPGLMKSHRDDLQIQSADLAPQF
jgi:hypothetical protein